jgi:hypothetical protein
MVNPISINRIAKQYCETAGDLVSNDRAQTHGDASKSFDIVARLWSAYLTTNIAGSQVPLMMMMFKVARSMNGNFNKDDYVDMCGYAALAGEMATKQFEVDANGDNKLYRGTKRDE